MTITLPTLSLLTKKSSRTLSGADVRAAPSPRSVTSASLYVYAKTIFRFPAGSAGAGMRTGTDLAAQRRELRRAGRDERGAGEQQDGPARADGHSVMRTEKIASNCTIASSASKPPTTRPKVGVAGVEVRLRRERDEVLAAAGVGAAERHAERAAARRRGD